MYRIKKKIMNDTFEVPRKLISKLSEATENDLKLFLLMAVNAENDAVDTDILGTELENAGIPPEAVGEGLAFLRGAGLIEKASAKRTQKAESEQAAELTGEKVRPTPSQRPSYTAAQLAAAAENTTFKELVNWASARLGKMFGNAELEILYSFKDYLCLPDDVIMLAIEHCATQGKASLRYIEKMLIGFADKDINTYQKAEEYILNQKKYISFESVVRQIIGIESRALSSKEKSMVSKWCEWQISDELLRLAYDKTVDNTKKFSPDYMHKIIESWHTLGFKTVAEVNSGDTRPKSNSSYDTEDFFRIALERSKE